MKKISKNDCMDFHVLKRFRQRFRVFFGQKDIENIVKLIVNCETEPIFQLSNSRRVHIVEYNGITFGCVYNKLRKRIHTVFPKEWIDDGSFIEHMMETERYEEVSKVNKTVHYTMPINNKNKRIVRSLM